MIDSLLSKVVVFGFPVDSGSSIYRNIYEVIAKTLE